MSEARSRRRGNEGRTGAEVVTLCVSSALLLALVGALAWLELTQGDEPPRVRTKLHFDQASERDGDWYLPVTITNTGDESTDVLRVAIERPIPGEQPEVADLDFAFVAGSEQVRGIAVFDEEPTPDTIEVDVVSITEP